MATILVVEDNPAIRGLVKALLKTRGHDCMETANGVMALTVTQRARPDLIILDLQMASMDGFTFLRRLRAEPEIAATRVLLHTSQDTPENARTAAELGVTTIVGKASSPDALFAAVEKELGAA
jgi:CheY-like chemotaxis protein